MSFQNNSGCKARPTIACFERLFRLTTNKSPTIRTTLHRTGSEATQSDGVSVCVWNSYSMAILLSYPWPIRCAWYVFYMTRQHSCRISIALPWRHNERDGVSNRQPHDCLLRHRSKETSKLRVIGLYAATGEFPAQMVSNAKNVFILWRHHGIWNSFPSSAAYVRHHTGSALVQIMACRLFDANPLPEPMLTYCKLDP